MNRGWVTLHFSFASSLIMSLPMTNSMWVIFFFHLAVSSCHMPNSMWVTGTAFLLIHGCPCLIPWPTGGEWHILPCSIMSHPWSHNQQSVSDFFWQGSLIVSHPITNSMWVTVWHCIFFFRQSHTLSHLMTNRGWVILHFLLSSGSVTTVMSHPVSSTQ